MFGWGGLWTAGTPNPKSLNPQRYKPEVKPKMLSPKPSKPQVKSQAVPDPKPKKNPAFGQGGGFRV